MISVEYAAACETNPASSNRSTDTGATLTVGVTRNITADSVTIDRMNRKKNTPSTVGAISGRTASRSTCTVPPPRQLTASSRACGTARIPVIIVRNPCPQHQARHPDRQHGKQIYDLGPAPSDAAHAKTQEEQQQQAAAGRGQRQVQRSPQGCVAAADGDVVVLERPFHAVRPQAHEAGEHHGRHRQDDRAAGQQHPNAERRIARPQRLGRHPQAAGRCRSELALRGHAFDLHRNQRRQEQQDAHHRAHPEIHLARHLAVDLRGQHAVIAADHRRVAEVGDGDDEHHERGAQQAELAVGQGDVEELPRSARPGAGRRTRSRSAAPRSRRCRSPSPSTGAPARCAPG
ncbi:hypothetical protein G6F65_016580 [Rhizopus arrhizus]|nr:hypothetical protein G6F65_016580 [Rhizopus arrhizus]